MNLLHLGLDASHVFAKMEILTRVVRSLVILGVFAVEADCRLCAVLYVHGRVLVVRAVEVALVALVKLPALGGIPLHQDSRRASRFGASLISAQALERIGIPSGLCFRC